MLAALLDGGGEREKLLRVNAGRCMHRADLRLTARERAGLVKDDRIRLPGVFERGAGLEEDAVLGGHAGADHEPRRNGKSERAGAGDGEHVAAGDHCAGELPWPEREVPEPERGCRRAEYTRHEPARHPVGIALHGRLFVLRAAHDVDDLLQNGVLAERERADLRAAGAVQTAAHHTVACRLVHRQALARQHGFVHRKRALQDFAVHRDAVARAHEHDVAFGDAVGVNLHERSVAQNHGGFRLQMHELADRAAGLPCGDLLEILSEQDQ